MSIRPQLHSLIHEFAAPRFKTVAITDETNLVEHLGFDSVSLVELVVRVEEVFDVEFDDGEMNVNLLTQFASLHALVTSKLAVAPGATA